MAQKPLTQKEIETEIQRIMDGEGCESDPFEDSGNNDLLIPQPSANANQANLFENSSTATQQPLEETSNNDIGEQGLSTNAGQSNLSQHCPSPKSNDSERNMENNLFLPRYIIKPKTKYLKGKNGHKWSAEMPERCGKTKARNIIHFLPGPKADVTNCSTYDEYFLHLFSNEMLDIILLHRNAEITRQAEKYKSNANVFQTTKIEIKALLAILIKSAAHKDNHLLTKYMFDTKISGTFYRACMSGEHFSFLINCLRFDDKGTKLERKKADSFAPIREIWDIFIAKYRNSYIPSSYLTIDEQLIGFRGRCPFRMYIPSKPCKYAIKIIMVCDSSSKYMLDASPYLGKSTKTNGLPLATYFVKELTKSVHGSNRNITMDNWFTSVGLANDLLKDPYKLTIIGTLRKNKREIPKKMLNVRERNPNTSMFCHDQMKTMVLYVPKKNKIVLLLSTLHEGAEISSIGKPAIIMNYDETKGGIDTFD
ncbi:piggyBac transposable element-derived protein 4-like [Euwallacea similis]|uniref:piggyBac transposable element-derived protein 4-like n=1 Tax=Euwallacea similis TaxID=1736056 RepID=UPI00344BD0F0